MKYFVLCLMLICLLTGCYISPDDVFQATRSSVTIASVTPDLSPQATRSPNGYYDALASTMGICFEAAWDAAGQVFIIRNAEDHIHFYDLADNSDLCRRAVRREPFDFSGGDVLIGIWNRGQACTAQHDISIFERNDSARTIIIHAQFSTEGDCSYDLVRGLWLGIEDAQDYAISLIVE